MAFSSLRRALRAMRKNPGFTAVAVASLALGIGVNTVIFSLAEQLLLWSVPARAPEQLVSINGGYADTYPFFREYRDRNQVFSDLFASSNNLAAGIRPEGSASVEVGNVQYVSGNYFQGLGVGAAVGRAVTPSDDAAPGSGPIAVLSYGYWQRRFDGDLSVLGRKLAVNGFPLQIVGIAERGFGGVYSGRAADIFVPISMFPVTMSAAAPAWNTTNMSWLTPIGRLKDGMSKSQAEAAMRVLLPQAAEAVNAGILRSGGKANKFSKEQVSLESGVRPEPGGNPMLDPLKALAFGTGLVLLIACANVANLLLARSSARRREVGVRLALGATRWRLVRQFLGESLVLAAAGGIVALLLAWWGAAALAKSEILRPGFRFHLSPMVLAFSAGITLFTGVLFGLAPAFRATRLSLAESIKDGGGGGRHASRVRGGKALVAVQVALSLALLAGAGLFIRTLSNLRHVDLGFQQENVLIVDVDPTNVGYRGHRLRAFYDEVLERTKRIPGVRAAALSSMTPMGSSSRAYSFSAEGVQPKSGEMMLATENSVSAGYFTAMGIPMLSGRDFRAQDEPTVTPGETLISAIMRVGSGGTGDRPANASRICIIDETLARRLYGNTNPIGKHLSFSDTYEAGSDLVMEIVGVVKAAHYDGVQAQDVNGVFYIPSWSNGAEVRSLEVRYVGDASAVIPTIRRTVNEVDPNVPVLEVRTMREYVDMILRRERMVAALSGVFAALALCLAAIGLYGVMAYSVSQRTREIGIRMALGACRTDVLGLVLREAMVPVVAGVALGIAGLLMLSRIIASLLYGVARNDVVTIALATTLLLAVAALAAALPARRASQVEPLEALRYE
jgi:predicted permease